MTRYAPQWIQAASYGAAQDRRLIAALWPGPASSGCAVVPVSAMTVQIQAGQVAVPTQNNSGTTLCTSDAAEQVTLTASAAQPRIDLITCHPRGTDLDGGTNNDFIFDFVTGTPAASPTVPATPAGQVALAQIAVGAGVASIVAGNITDVRPGGLAVPTSSSPRGYVNQATGPASQTDCTTLTVLVTLTVPVVAGRRYRATGSGFGLQQTATSTSASIRIYDPSGAFVTAGNSNSLPAGQGLNGAAASQWQAAATGNATWLFQASSNAGSLRFAANACSLFIEDIGTG